MEEKGLSRKASGIGLAIFGGLFFIMQLDNPSNGMLAMSVTLAVVGYVMYNWTA